MSRIRSVHPGLWTDEAFVCLSDAAQIFFIGLWTECDDQGAFEWKPIQLRLKLRGNRDGSVEPILAELQAANCILRYEYQGRKYGLVRNFQRFQRPKKPNSIHHIPPQFLWYVGEKGANLEQPPSVEADSSEAVPHQFPTSGEKSPQMEDGGGRMEEEEEELCCVSRASSLEAQLREAANWQSHPSPNLFITGPIEALIDAGADLERDVLPVIRAIAPRCRNPNWKYFLDAIADARDKRLAAAGNSATIIPINPQNTRNSHGPNWKKPSRDDSFAAIDAAIDELERRQRP